MVFTSSRRGNSNTFKAISKSLEAPLLKNEWVEMGDPAPPHRRTHGGTSAGVLALVKPLPPKAVAGRPGFTGATRPRLRSPPADRWAVVRNMRSRQASCRARYITHSKFNRAKTG